MKEIATEVVLSSARESRSPLGKSSYRSLSPIVQSSSASIPNSTEQDKSTQPKKQQEQEVEMVEPIPRLSSVITSMNNNPIQLHCMTFGEVRHEEIVQYALIVINSTELVFFEKPTSVVALLSIPLGMIEKVVFCYSRKMEFEVHILDSKHRKTILSFDSFEKAQTVVVVLRNACQIFNLPPKPEYKASIIEVLEWVDALTNTNTMKTMDLVNQRELIRTEIEKLSGVSPEHICACKVDDGRERVVIIRDNQIIDIETYFKESKMETKPLGSNELPADHSILLIANSLKEIVNKKQNASEEKQTLFSRLCVVSAIRNPSPDPLLFSILTEINPDWAKIFMNDPALFKKGLRCVK